MMLGTHARPKLGEREGGRAAAAAVVALWYCDLNICVRRYGFFLTESSVKKKNRSYELCRVLWFFLINYLRKKILSQLRGVVEP